MTISKKVGDGRMKQKLSVRAVIKQGDAVLFVRRAIGNPKYIGQFELPGGKVDFGETPEGALRREVQEEIGVSPGAVQLERIVSWIDTMERATQHVIIVYLVALGAGQARLRLSSEHDKFVWKKLSDIQQDTLNVLTKVALQDEHIYLATDKKASDTKIFVDNKSTFGAHDEVVIFADGGSRGNPGPSAAGFVIYGYNEEVLFEGGAYLGVTTNNQAEYQAVKLALQEAQKMGARVVRFKLDSQLVVNQLTGIYQIKNRDLWPIHSNIKELISFFEKVTFVHIRREFNQAADGMVNKILDTQEKR